MTPLATLDELILQAHRIHRLTKDPLVASAILVLTDRHLDAVVRDEEELDLSGQETLAAEMVQRLEDARFTLYGNDDHPG